MATDRPGEQPHVAADLPDWDTVYERQLQRADLAREWLDALALQPGERVLDAGCGTGYVSLEAARRVGPAGRVYAVDSSAEALAYLGRLQDEQGVDWIERIVADAAALPALPGDADAALVTLVLHHADDPAGLLRNVARLLPDGARVAVAEFHPDGPCEVGAPRERRLPPERVRSWCEAGGFDRLAYRRQSPEHYVFTMYVHHRERAK